MDDLEVLRQRIGVVLSGHRVVFAYLFGSRARGEARPDSDVDVAVRYEPGLDARDRFPLTLRLGGELESAIGRRVDLVDLVDAPLRLVGRILRERLVVVGLDEPERVAFETHRFKLATDFELHAAELDRAALRAMAEGRR